MEKLEEAKRLYQTANADQKYVLESLFPELAEPEDERIRKWIIKQIKTYDPSNIREEALNWLEKQGGSKETHDENLEPLSFKLGDYIISNRGINDDIFFVNEIQDGDMYGLFDMNGDYFQIARESIESQYHLWTIQDAKPGDILTIDEVPVMFKNNFDNCIDTYCYLKDDIEQWSFNSSFKIFNKNCIINPAESEDRRLLLRKMKEA